MITAQVSTVLPSLSWIAEQLQHPLTRFVPLWRSRNFFLKDGDPGAALMTSAEFGDIKETARTPILLGKEKGVVYFAVDLPSENDLIPDKMADWGRFLDLGKMGALLEESQGKCLYYGNRSRVQRFKGSKVVFLSPYIIL